MDPELAGDPPPEAGDDVELVVLDVKAHAPGFYTNRTRTYFVAQDGAVYRGLAEMQQGQVVDETQVAVGREVVLALQRDRLARRPHEEPRGSPSRRSDGDAASLNS